MSEEKKEAADTAATAAPAPDNATEWKAKAEAMKKKFGLKEIYRDRLGYWYSTKPEGAAGKDYTQY